MHNAKRGNRQAGQALYITAVSLVVVVGLLGLGIDMGALRYEKRLQQTAADAAAVAGASNLAVDGTGSLGVVDGAKNASAANGFRDSGADCGADAAVGTVCVQVNNPPQQSAKHNGDRDAVEVLVSAVHPTYFMRIFGVTKETVTARAVATNVAGGQKPCLLALNVSGSATGLVVNGTVHLTACNLIVNGNLQVSTPIDARRGSLVEVTGTCSGDCSGVSTGVPAAADPLANLPPSAPPPNGCLGLGLLGTLGLNVCNSLSIGPGTPPLADGLYVVDGVLSVAAGATLNAGGSTFYLPTGVMNLNAGSTVTANALVVGQPLTVNAGVTLDLGGGGNSPIKSAVLVE